MEHSHKYFQLAHSYDHYAPRTNSVKRTLSRLPFPIPQEALLSEQIFSAQRENIFNNNQQLRYARMQTQPSNGYEYVGIKEMRSYVSRMDKKKTLTTNSIKRSTETHFTNSKVDVDKVQQEKKFTRQEVIHSRHSINPNYTEQIYLISPHSTHSPLQKTFSTQNMTLNSSQNATLSSHKKCLSHDFSLSKITSQMKEYEQIWQKQIVRKEARQIMKGSKHYRKPFSSVLKSIKQFRKKVQEKQQQTLKEQQENIQPNMWSLILRSTKTMPNLFQKEIPHIFQPGLTSIGHNKQQKEMIWIEEKDKQGHLFRMPKNPYTHR